MPHKVPFLHGVHFQKDDIEFIEARLSVFLRKFRKDRPYLYQGPPLDEFDDEELFNLPDHGDVVTARDRQKIIRRGKRLIELRRLRGGLAHLRKEEVALLETCRSGVSLRGPANIHAVDELAGALMEELPWMSSAIEPIWRDARVQVAQERGFGFKPILLVGPPGIGKTHLLRMIANLAGTPCVMLDASAAGDGFSIAGSQRSWANSTPGRPVSSILQSGCGNPMIFVDEIDKAGSLMSTRGTSTSALTALLGLLEPVSAARWNCPFYGVTFDMSRVNWVLAANSIKNMPEPLLSRCRVVHLDALSREHLLGFAAREIERRGLHPDIYQDVAHALELIPDEGDRLNIRMMQKIIDMVSDVYNRPHLH